MNCDTLGTQGGEVSEKFEEVGMNRSLRRGKRMEGNGNEQRYQLMIRKSDTREKMGMKRKELFNIGEEVR